MADGVPVPPRRSTSQADDPARSRVLQAARELLMRDGYVSGTVDIAERAGVDPAAVSALFGSRSGLLRALHEDADARSGRAELIAALQAASGDAQEQVRLIVRFDVDLYTRERAVISVAHAARNEDPELAAFLAAGRERGRQGRRPVVATWQAGGRLRAGLSLDEAVESFSAMCSFDLFNLLVVEGGWPVERYTAWLTDSVSRQLLTDEPA